MNKLYRKSCTSSAPTPTAADAGRRCGRRYPQVQIHLGRGARQDYVDEARQPVERARSAKGAAEAHGDDQRACDFRSMEFARDMVKACTGVNEEILGIVGRDQPGVLEQQRKQAAYGILSAFFDAKRRYQREQGRLLLAQIKIFLPDDTLVRILDQGTAVYIPIARALTDAEYDVVVDEAPAGPNQKAKVMAVLGPLLPEMFASGIIRGRADRRHAAVHGYSSVGRPTNSAKRSASAQAAQQPSPQQQQMEQAQRGRVRQGNAEQGRRHAGQTGQGRERQRGDRPDHAREASDGERVKAVAGVQVDAAENFRCSASSTVRTCAMEGRQKLTPRRCSRPIRQHRLRLAQSADQHRPARRAGAAGSRRQALTDGARGAGAARPERRGRPARRTGGQPGRTDERSWKP